MIQIVLVGLALSLVAAAGPIAPLLFPSLVPEDLRWSDDRRDMASAPRDTTAVATRRRRFAPWLIGALALCLALVPAIRAAVEARGAGAPITGDLPSTAPLATTSAQAVQALQAQVAASPDDIQARIALARLEFSQGSLAAAADQYLAVLQLDPSNAEAKARLGFVLATSGHAKAGLQAVDRTIAEDPTYAEALFLKGLILSRYLHDPAQAATALHAFLARQTTGAEAAAARKLLSSAGR